MASKKQADIPVAKNVYPGEKLVTIKLPIIKGERDYVFVNVNERNWQIQRGVYVQVPECVAEVLDHAEQAELDAMEYMAAHQKGEN